MSYKYLLKVNKLLIAVILNFLDRLLIVLCFGKKRIDELTFKLSKACYAVKLVKPFMSLSVLRLTYFACVYSVTHGRYTRAPQCIKCAVIELISVVRLSGE